MTRDLGADIPNIHRAINKIDELIREDNGIVGIWTFFGIAGDHTCTIQFDGGCVVKGKSNSSLLEAVNTAIDLWKNYWPANRRSSGPVA